jgi:hypothetical protein
MIVIDDIEQGSPEWFALKLGKPSASNMHKIIGSRGTISAKQREPYLYELAAERITGKAEEGYKSQAMEVGNAREQRSRSHYEFIHGVEVEQVGVVYKDETRKYLCSPDGLIDRARGLELKNVLPKTQIAYLFSGKVPTTYFVQVQASLFICEMDRWDFMSYCPGLKSLIIKVGRDSAFISKLKVAIDDFVDELEEVTEKIKGLM